MYALFSKKTFNLALTFVVALALNAANIASFFGLDVPDRFWVSNLPAVLVALALGLFGTTGFYSPWRWLWRMFPILNKIAFPDLNGVWVGVTRSNWPVIETAFDAAITPKALTEAQIYSTPLKEDAIAVLVECSLFRIQIKVAASATQGDSHSVAARPSFDQDTGAFHVMNIYKQKVEDPQPTDEPFHLGAADLRYHPDEPEILRGEYWTRRVWRKGKNTAGNIELRRLSRKKAAGKTLRQLAAEEKERLSGAKSDRPL